MQYDAKERLTTAGQSEWYFEEKEVELLATGMLLVRITIGKVVKNARLVRVLHEVPVRQSKRGWNCVSWMKEALEAIDTDGQALGTSVVGWQTARERAMWYIEKKKAEHRFDGKWNFDMRFAPTYNLLDGKETMR